MERTVRKMLQTCEICQKAKVNNHKQEGLMQHVMPDSPLALVAVDLWHICPGITHSLVPYPL